MSGASQIASRPTVRPPSRRSAAAADPHDRLAIELGRVAGADQEDPPGPELTGRGERGRIALGLELTERGERSELAPRPPIELVEWSLERRLVDDRDDEDVRGDVPRLVVDDTDLHGDRASETFAYAVELPRPTESTMGLRAVYPRPDGRSGRGRGLHDRLERVGERRLGFLDRDHRPVQAALSDVGHDDHEAARIGWQASPRGLLGFDRACGPSW